MESCSTEGKSIGERKVLSCGCVIGSDGPKTDGPGSMVIIAGVASSDSLPAEEVEPLVGRSLDKALQRWLNMDMALHKGTLGKARRLHWGTGSVGAFPSINLRGLARTLCITTIPKMRF